MLHAIEQALKSEDLESYRRHLSPFLLSRLQLTWESLLEYCPEIDEQSLRELKAQPSELTQAVSSHLWTDEALSPFGTLLLDWYQERVREDALYLSPEDFTSYLKQVGKPLEETPSVETPAKPPVVPAKATQKTDTPKPTTAEADGEVLELSTSPLSPLEAQSQLVLKKKYFGYGKNIDGVMGYCGQFTISRFDDGPVEVTLECSNPLLFLSTQTVQGRRCVVTYWMPPAAFPQPGGHLTLQSPQHRKVISVGSLFPLSRTDYLSGRQVATLLLAPSVLALCYFEFVYLTSSYGILQQVQQLFPEEVAAAKLGQGVVNFRAQGVGLYQLEVVPTSESLQLIWAATIWLAPLLAAKFFRHLSRERQRDFGTLLGASLVLPSLGLLLAWHLQKRLFPLFEHPDFFPLDLRGFLAWGVPLNLAVAMYLFVSVHGVWERRLSSGLRFLLPISLSLLYGLLIFVLIFGRSWTA